MDAVAEGELRVEGALALRIPLPGEFEFEAAIGGDVQAPSTPTLPCPTIIDALERADVRARPCATTAT